jgi:hypothetical protein
VIAQPAIETDNLTPPGTFDSLRTRPEVSLCIVDDEALLFDARHRKLYAANTTAAFIWCCLDDGLKPVAIASKIVTTFRISLIEADRYLVSALKSWIRLDLVADRDDAEESASVADSGFTSSLHVEPVPASMARGFGPVREACYRLLDTDFRLCFQSVETCQAMDVYLRPFTAPPVDQGIARNSVRIDLMERGDLCALVHDGRILEKWARSDEIVPIAKLVLITLALERSQDFGAVHAAAVHKASDTRCLLLPGQSGAGKSTLTAALAGDGFVALGDDTIVLARDSLDARPIPFGVCLKDGSWNLLANRFPQLASYPVHHRPDGKRVRYLMPDNGRPMAATQDRHIVTWMIFPERNDHGEARLVPLRRHDALSRFILQFCPLGAGWDSLKIERLAQWMPTVACFELRFSTLEQGVQQIKELCA